MYDEITLHLSRDQAQLILDALYDVEPATDGSTELIEALEGALHG